MLFSSQIFLFYFLPLFLLFYWRAGQRARIRILTVFSYIFYGWWDWRFLFLILFSTAIDYYCGLWIHQSASEKKRKALLFLSVAMNLSLLGFFKYFMFANHSLAAVCSWIGLDYPDTLLAIHVILPVGISFYTFQSMSYTIDIYRRMAQPTRCFMDFACYIAMFPQLVAGPIVRYTHMENQIHRPFISADRVYQGLQFFILGLAKKVLVADSASILSNAFFDQLVPSQFSGWDAVFGVLAYTVQIYYDFSGYSDMAIGLGYFCGYEFPVNFNSPYKALSITEFWRRWHITLSTWLRDYLYIPLGGSRHGRWKTYRNLALTMLLGGLWHGANWHYVVWGAYHGIGLAIERALGDGNPLKKLPPILQWLGTFVLVMLGWILFRAQDLPTAWLIIRNIFSGDYSQINLLNVTDCRVGFAAVWLGLAIALFAKNSWEIGRNATLLKTLILLGLFILSIGFLFGAVSHPFLYFQF